MELRWELEYHSASVAAVVAAAEVGAEVDVWYPAVLYQHFR